jgi:hypothetical protein
MKELVDRLASEAEITRLLHLYCHSADTLDRPKFLSVFHDDSTHDHAGIFQGLSRDFCDFALGVFERDVPVTQHHLSNILIELDGDHARSSCYFLAYHLIPGTMSAEVMTGHCEGRDEVYLVGGRYFDHLERREGAWKIAHRTAVHDWVQWEDVRDGGYRRSAKHRTAPIGFPLYESSTPRFEVPGRE